MKRIPLDISIQEYEVLKHVAEMENESVNGYIKKAINMRYVSIFTKVHPNTGTSTYEDMKVAIADHESGIDPLDEEDLKFATTIVHLVENGIINDKE